VKQNNNFLRLGDIFRITKNNSLSGPINRNFSLLGDPSLTLNYPKLDIEINIPDSLSIDTLSALEKYSFKGEIINNGKKVENFNGEVFSFYIISNNELSTVFTWLNNGTI